MAPTKRKGGARKAAAAASAAPAAADKLTAEKEESAEETVPAADVDEDKAESEPSPKKTKVEEKKKRGRKPKAPSKGAVGSTKKIADDDCKAEEEGAVEEEGAAEDEVTGSDVAGKVIVIEASKECNCFKTRAATVQTGLTKAIPGIEVLINPEKPRKGCFEVRGKEGNIYLSLLGLPRPFTKLKNMDMVKAIEEIVAKVK